MKKSRFSIILLIFVLFVVIRLIGITYGYYSLIIKGDNNVNSLSVNTKYVSVEYQDGSVKMNFEGDYLFPGDTAEKRFIVKNTSEYNVKYNILIDNIINEFVRIQDLSYVLFINDEEASSGIINKNKSQYLFGNKMLESGASDSIRFVFEYAITKEAQNIDMNKTISFRFNIDSSIYNFMSTDTGIANLSKVETISKYKIYGNSIQNGTPSLETPIEIESVGDKTKNLFDGKVKQGAYLAETGAFSPIKNYIATENPILVKENTNYTIKRIKNINDTSNSYAQHVLFYDEENTYLGYSNISNQSTFTSLDNAKYMYINIYGGEDNITIDQVGTIQIEEGSVATDYEPYGYKIPVKVSKENKLVVNDVNYNGASMKYTVKNGVIRRESVIPNVETSYLLQTSAFDEIIATKTLEAGTYIWGIINASGKTISNPYIQLSVNGETINWYANTSITLEEQATILYFRTDYIGYTKGTFQQFEIIIEEGTELTASITNIYLNEPLRKIGDYADYIDFEKQKVFRNVEVLDDTGTLSLEESLKGVIDDVGTNIELPNIPTNNGTNIIKVGTNILPSNIELEYVY